VALRAYCQAGRAGPSRAAARALLDVLEPLSDRLRRAEQRVAQLFQAQYGSKRERVSATQLQLALEQLSAPESVAPQAVGYAVRQWQTLETFLCDGAVRIDNNHCERTLRPIGCGRKNWLFGGSDEGARWLAIHQSLLSTALLVGIQDPWPYLRDILTKLARGWPNARLCELLPQAWIAAATPAAPPTAPSLA